MKITLHSILFLAVSILFSHKITAQGLIINEFSNGTSGVKEFVELVVIGSAAAPLTPVDLRGWIIDDNNGAFGGTGTGKGIATGHIRISPSCAAMSDVPVGAIIVIYNSADVSAAMPAADPTDSNGDLIYIIPSNHNCLQVCTTLPSSSNANYNCGSYAAPTGTSWNTVSLGNAGDAFQTRRPDASFFHGYAYGDITGNGIFPTFPAELGGGTSFNVNTASGASITYPSTCGAFNANSTYERTSATNETPGAFNNGDNANLIQNIRNGSYNYSNPADPANCTLPLYLVDFDAHAQSLYNNILTWTLATVDPQSWVNIQQSHNGIDFTTIEKMPLEAIMDERTYHYTDFTPYQTTYYRLEFTEPNAKTSYSQVRVVSQKAQEGIILFPNPAREQLHISFDEPIDAHSQYTVLDALGRNIIVGEIAKGEAATTISTYELPAGTYFLHIQTSKTTIIRNFIKL